MNKNKYFKVTLIDHNDDEAIYNTFSCYLCVIVLLISVILDQWEWNSITMIATSLIGILLYRIGYRLGNSC